jgi:hypothetical protein
MKSMNKSTNKSETEKSRKLSLKKETLQHLKVRTDLKGGVVALAGGKCTVVTHHCSAA